MLRLTKWFLPLFVLGLLPTFGQSHRHTVPGHTRLLCTETAQGQTATYVPAGINLPGGIINLSQGGCVSWIPSPSPVGHPTPSHPLFVASDGEIFFDPFRAGYDTTEGIQLNSNWLPDPAYASAFATGFWTKIPGTFTWVLPASTHCGSENEPQCEPFAKWYAPGYKWPPDIQNILYILESHNLLSDVILLDNSGPGGSAAIIFASD